LFFVLLPTWLIRSSGNGDLNDTSPVERPAYNARVAVFASKAMAGRPRVEVDEAWLGTQCSKDYRDWQIAQSFEEEFGHPISSRLISTRRKELGLLRRAEDDDEVVKKITDWRNAPHGDNGGQQGVRLMRSHLLLAHSMRIGLNRLARLHHQVW
jgi:hypothetical protein